MIKVIFSNGKPLSIDVTNLPKNVGHVDGDKIATEIGKQIGRNLGAVRIGGYWIIGDTTDNKWFPIYGHQAGQQTRSFEKLLREGLQLGTVRMVPLKPKATK